MTIFDGNGYGYGYGDGYGYGYGNGDGDGDGNGNGNGKYPCFTPISYTGAPEDCSWMYTANFI